MEEADRSADRPAKRHKWEAEKKKKKKKKKKKNWRREAVKWEAEKKKKKKKKTTPQASIAATGPKRASRSPKTTKIVIPALPPNATVSCIPFAVATTAPPPPPPPPPGSISLTSFFALALP